MGAQAPSGPAVQSLGADKGHPAKRRQGGQNGGHMDAQESIKLLIRRIEKNLGELRTFVDDERNAEQDRKHAKMLLDDGEEKLAQARRIAEELQRHG